MHNHSYENEFNLHVNEISFSYEKMGTKTRFEEEAKGNSEMAYLHLGYFGRQNPRWNYSRQYTMKIKCYMLLFVWN